METYTHSTQTGDVLPTVFSDLAKLQVDVYRTEIPNIVSINEDKQWDAIEIAKSKFVFL